MNVISTSLTSDIAFRKTRFGHSADVVFGVKTVYSDFGGWSRRSDETFYALTFAGLERKIARRTSALQKSLRPTA